MIYIVTGWMRSGTTMMARALDVGGMSVVRSAQRDQFNKQASDAHYRPNPDSLYELTQREMRQPGFPLEHRGKALKVVVPFLPLLSKHTLEPFPPGPVREPGYRVVFMRRDAEEIRQSYYAAFAGARYDETLGNQPRLTAEVIDGQVAKAQAYLHGRDDVLEVKDLWYREVLADPVGALSSLDWPIDVARAASVVDPAQCRFRREALEVGI